VSGLRCPVRAPCPAHGTCLPIVRAFCRGPPSSPPTAPAPPPGRGKSARTPLTVCECRLRCIFSFRGTLRAARGGRRPQRGRPECWTCFGEHGHRGSLLSLGARSLEGGAGVAQSTRRRSAGRRTV
jgi:hypothetical protein